MACCLTAPSHCLNQCWLTINKVQRHSSEGNFTIDTSAINHWHYLENYLSKISFKSPRGQWLKMNWHIGFFLDMWWNSDTPLRTIQCQMSLLVSQITVNCSVCLTVSLTTNKATELWLSVRGMIPNPPMSCGFSSQGLEMLKAFPCHGIIMECNEKFSAIWKSYFTTLFFCSPLFSICP